MSNRVRVRVPHETSVLTFPSGDTVTVKVDEAGAYADVLEDDACLLLFSGLPQSIAWRERNQDLVDRLKPPPRIRAMRVVDLERAADMAKPVNPFDRAAIARQTLAACKGGQ